MKPFNGQIWKDTLTGRKIRVVECIRLVVHYEFIHNRGNRDRKGRSASMFTNDFMGRFKLSK